MSFITRSTKIYNEDEPKKRHSSEASYMHYGPYEDLAEDQELVEVKVVHVIGHKSHLTKAQTRWLEHEDQRAQAQKGIPVDIPVPVKKGR